MAPEPSYAFFDVDDTLIRVKSMFSFYRFWCLEYRSDEKQFAMFEQHFQGLRAANEPREVLNREYYRFYASVSPLVLADAGEAWAAKMLSGPHGLFYQATVDMLQRLRDGGTIPVFVSGSFDEVLEPLARQFDVHHILATPMMMCVGGVYSGEIGTPQTIGDGKAVAVAEFLADKNVPALRCAAFGDDISDLPMLDAVGHPHVVGQGTQLTRIALERNWPIIDVEPAALVAESI